MSMTVQGTSQLS